MSDPVTDFDEAVLDLVERIPPGRVMTYGDIAAHLQRGGARGVGGVMARHGDAVAWWRVVRSTGLLPAHLMIEAQRQWHREGTPPRRGGVDLETARWDPG
ncbi:MGMT family protein [Jatrophihabitans sp. YIM 134969]